MRRRGLTVLVGAICAFLLIWQIAEADVPYVSLSPGPTVDTLSAPDRCSGSDADDKKKVIDVSGAQTSDSKGQLRMVTVSVQSQMTLLEAIRGWFSDTEAVLPRKLLYPDDVSEKEVEEQNKQDFVNSQSSAETVALRKLDIPTVATVGQVVADGASAGKLKAGDVIDSVDGVAVPNSAKLLELIRAKPAGTALQIGYTRDGAKATAEVTTKAAEDGTPRIGVSAQDMPAPPFKLSINLERIGGPSAGMMFALGIIDKLSPEDLTGGKIIAGTGTIDDEGKVGPIGGIHQKLYGARGCAEATVFLVPADNCDEAKQDVPDGLQLVKVATLDEALNALKTLREGGTPPSC